jgi:hypothetical protein
MPKGLRSLARSLENVPFIPVVAVLFGMVASILVLATPGWLFERGVVASGLPDIIAAAAPPLGDKAQIMAAIVAALGTTCSLWLVPTISGRIIKARRIEHQGDTLETRSEIVEYRPHPDSPVRRPLFAESDLGAPFMSDEAIAHAREELVLETIIADNPEPLETITDDAAPNLVEPFDEAMFQSQGEPLTMPAVVGNQPSIAGLLDRLERALERRERETGSSAPILPGKMAALREILGESAVRH